MNFCHRIILFAIVLTVANARPLVKLTTAQLREILENPVKLQLFLSQNFPNHLSSSFAAQQQQYPAGLFGAAAAGSASQSQQASILPQLLLQQQNLNKLFVNSPSAIGGVPTTTTGFSLPSSFLQSSIAESIAHANGEGILSSSYGGNGGSGLLLLSSPINSGNFHPEIGEIFVPSGIKSNTATIPIPSGLISTDSNFADAGLNNGFILLAPSLNQMSDGSIGSTFAQDTTTNPYSAFTAYEERPIFGQLNNVNTGEVIKPTHGLLGALGTLPAAVLPSSSTAGAIQPNTGGFGLGLQLKKPYHYAVLGKPNDNINVNADLGITSSFDSASTSGQSLGSTAQVSLIPCVLRVPNPIPLSVNPASGNIQAAQSTSGIPASFIDNSPPTVGVLRPPISPDDATFPTPTQPKDLLKELVARSPPQDHQDTIITNDDDNNNDDDKLSSTREEFTEDVLARNGFPLVYTIFPSSLQSSSTAPGAFAATSSSSVKNHQRERDTTKAASSTRPKFGKNPYFNVNKRKHFEFYEYF